MNDLDQWDDDDADDQDAIDWQMELAFIAAALWYDTILWRVGWPLIWPPVPMAGARPGWLRLDDDEQSAIHRGVQEVRLQKQFVLATADLLARHEIV